MHRRQVPADSILRLAADQAGVVSRQQALDAGLSRHVLARLVRDGGWQSLDRGLFLTDPGPVPWLSHVWAGLLITDACARASGRTAGTLHGLTDDRALPVEILVDLAARPRDRGWVTFRRERPGVRMASTSARPARTRVEDTVLDLCAGAEQIDVVGWVTAAVQRRLTTPSRLRLAVGRRAQVSHRSLLLALVDEVDAGIHSPLEWRYLVDVERAHGLPRAVRQLRIGSRYADAAYVEFAVLVELDGVAWHDAVRDRRRDNDRAPVWVTLRYGWAEVVTDPCRVAREVAAVLASKGWTGSIRGCARCVERLTA